MVWLMRKIAKLGDFCGDHDCISNMSSIWNEPYHISYANLCVLLLRIFEFNIHRIVSIKPLWCTCFVVHVYPCACFHTHTTYEYTVPQHPQILANHESMHHNKHVFCVPLHVMHSWVPLHQRCKASCPQTAKSDLHAHMGICMTAWGTMHRIRHCMCMVCPVVCITWDSINAKYIFMESPLGLQYSSSNGNKHCCKSPTRYSNLCKIITSCTRNNVIYLYIYTYLQYICICMMFA